MNTSNVLAILKEKSVLVHLGEIANEVKAGFACGTSELHDGDIPHLRPMNIDENCNLIFDGTRYISKEFFEDKKNYTLKAGDILFNNTNSTELVGKSCFIPEDIYCGFSNHMTRIRVNESLVDSYYLSNILFALYKQRVFESYCHKWVGQSGINSEILANVLIPLPPIKEQQKIAELFHSVNDSIEQAKQQEKSLLNLKN